MDSKTLKIFGSPGTGKTTELLKILEEKIAEGYKANRIGFFSFTRRAIKEARSRVIKKFKLSEDDLEYLENCLFEGSQTYNSKQLAKKLASDRQVYLSADRLRRVLKARKKDMTQETRTNGTKKN